jgi:hypothetical protein
MHLLDEFGKKTLFWALQLLFLQKYVMQYYF